MQKLREISRYGLPGVALLIVGLLCLLRSSPSSAHTIVEERWQWRADLGAEINADPHGVADFGIWKGPLSFNLYTDTLEVRWSPELAHGRWWAAARVEAASAGLMLTPWTDGAPDPSRALLASYGGLEGGWIRYLPKGLYAGVMGNARVYVFGARPSTTIPVPGLSPRGNLDAVAGWWQPTAQAWVRAGVDVWSQTVSPHVALEALYRPTWTVAPRLELRAGLARNQDEVAKTRVGGLNPYVVPVAGAAWAEWWVQDYVAGRAGLSWRNKWLELGVLADAAAFDGERAVGGAVTGRVRYHRFYAETAVGYAPWIPRADGVSRTSVWLLVGFESQSRAGL